MVAVASNVVMMYPRRQADRAVECTAVVEIRDGRASCKIYGDQDSPEGRKLVASALEAIAKALRASG